MACSNPWFKSHIKHSLNTKLDFYFRDYQIPCGWCLNCRKDRQNYFADRAKYELCKRLTASFVTFTYDDNFLLSECVPDINNKMSDGRPYATLRYDHLTKFIDNIRHYIKNHPTIQNVLCQPDFSYMYVGEYGDLWNRPHFHVLFFGLDFAYCKKIIFEQWKKGFIDVLPVLDGAIGYVTKYMDKQLFGDLAKIEYDDNFIARPRLRASKGFGKGLLIDNIKDIRSHDYTYACGRGLRRPISNYWKYLLTENNVSSFTEKIIIRDKNESRVAATMRTTYHLKDCSRKSISDWKLKQNKLREARLRESIIRSGKPAIDNRYYEERFGELCFKRGITDLPPDCLRSASRDYINLLKEAYSA